VLAVTSRLALLRSGASRCPRPPPGIDAGAYAAALFEDVAEVLHGLAGVDSLVLCSPGGAAAVQALVWPDVPVLEVAELTLRSAAGVAHSRGYAQLVVVAADAPDLPQLVLAKVFQALATSPVAVAGADGGGAVAIGLTLPVPARLPAVDLDTVDVVRDLTAAAPQDVVATPGWHRLREPADLHRLDPGLEGWEATRALLSSPSAG